MGFNKGSLYDTNPNKAILNQTRQFWRRHHSITIVFAFFDPVMRWSLFEQGKKLWKWRGEDLWWWSCALQLKGLKFNLRIKSLRFDLGFVLVLQVLVAVVAAAAAAAMASSNHSCLFLTFGAPNLGSRNRATHHFRKLVRNCCWTTAGQGYILY